MIEYEDDIISEHREKEYKHVIWKVTEYIERGFDQDEETLGYFVYKNDAKLFAKNLENSKDRFFIIGIKGIEQNDKPTTI